MVPFFSGECRSRYQAIAYRRCRRDPRASMSPPALRMRETATSLSDVDVAPDFISHFISAPQFILRIYSLRHKSLI